MASVLPSTACSARYTRPMPPAPTASRIVYPDPMVRPTSGSPDVGFNALIGNPQDGQNL